MPKIIKYILIGIVGCQTILGQNIPVPKNYTIIESVTGDLNNDGIDELVVAYNTEKEKDDHFESVPRELIIYKKENKDWNVWITSKDALYGSKDGGMMGDPFEGIEINKGILLISQNGGSSWKWGHTDKYRYQDGTFYLIGYSSNFGKLCEYFTDVHFNLSTGKINITKEYESCENEEKQVVYKKENETFYYKDIKITIDNRSSKEIIIISPKYKHQIYLSTTEN
ncbi:hypothetical protein [Flavobacterium sp.]|uniref:hypothetical protein n=1 Tax=Flavobacterium sp. TaxID=239 RepID=UPI002612BA61|nr:hypothetical protein [Flavobacterium sp.]